jgi:hypothetical protein
VGCPLFPDLLELDADRVERVVNGFFEGALLLLGCNRVTGNLEDDEHAVRVVRATVVMLREPDANVRDVVAWMQIGHARFNLVPPFRFDVCMHPFDFYVHNRSSRRSALLHQRSIQARSFLPREQAGSVPNLRIHSHPPTLAAPRRGFPQEAAPP